MGDWLKLTEADIEQAQRQAQAAPLTPAVLKIGTADLPATPATPTPPEARHTAPAIRITEADLRAVPPQSTTAPDLDMLEQVMFALVNAARQASLPRWLGTIALRWHPGLAAVARGHSADMLQRLYVDHLSPEGVTAAQRIERYGIRYLACGENIGVVYGAASHSQQGIYDIHHAFMNQPRSLTNHRGNLLNPIWTHVGIGVAYHPSGSLIVTQNFILTAGR